MRSLAEARTAWSETLKHCSSFASLQQAVKHSGQASPAISGCRSLCWKILLLFKDSSQESWSPTLKEARDSYRSSRDQHLKYIEHPEKLSELACDPLADVPDSPWDALRQDELIRAEILQDVRRLPDEPFYRHERVQSMILDILFIYCKVNPGAGGYRQGMHELLAPIVFVVDQDSLGRAPAPSAEAVDPSIMGMFDPCFVEHDAFALFSTIMQSAKAFYETGPQGTTALAGDHNYIVEKSQYIHEVLLMKVDPELAAHLKNIEVLPQIFLIRWVRLLFGREFPFEQLLVLWDTIFALDPSLQLIDLICVAMLIRIRWTLLETDYSVALQLLLKYPAPEGPDGPHTFVDDAIYLRDHPDTAGGSELIQKYSGRAPATPQDSPRPTTPTSQGSSTPRNRTPGARSPLSAKLLQPPGGGVEAIFQGAAKGVIERGERLGIGQAVRGAMGEIRRNVKEFHDTRQPPGGRARAPSNDTGAPPRATGATRPEQRNRRLAATLGEAVTGLKTAARPGVGVADPHAVAAIDAAVAKIQLVQRHLQDPSLAPPEDEMPAAGAPSISPRTDRRNPTVALDTTPATARPSLSSCSPPHAPVAAEPAQYDGAPDPPAARARPALGAVPTRSTLAQSSFAWMLEPADGGVPPAAAGGRSRAVAPAARTAAGRRDGRNAFLFGEAETEVDGGEPREGVFGMVPMKGGGGGERVEGVHSPGG